MSFAHYSKRWEAMNLAGHASDNFGHIAGFLRSVMKEIGDAVLAETSVLCRWATKCPVVGVSVLQKNV